MTQPGRAGRASIEIVGDVSKLGRQLERDAQRAVSDIDLDTSNLSKQIGDGFKDGVAEAVESLEEIDPAAALASDNLVDRFRGAADEIADAFDRTGDRVRNTFDRNRKDSDRLFDSIGENARDTGEDVKTNLLRPLTSGFSRLGETITSAGSALVGFAVTGTNPAGLLSLAANAAAVAAATPVIIGLAAALADLAGVVTLLPGVIGALSASLIVGIVAFQGFGDAISAVIAGDPEKIAEAMERLAPAARTVVREFERVLPLFRQLGDEIQQGFFGQLTGIVQRFGETALPRLRSELLTLSAVMGRAFGDLGDLITATENVSILERLIISTARVTSDLGAAFTNLGQAFFNAIDAGLPSLETLSTRLADAITNFANFINASIADGSFQAFLDDAIATLDELLALGGAVGELLGVLFTGTDDAGRSFIATLTDLTKRLTEFFKSAEGQDALEDFGEIMAAVGIILGVGFNILRDLIDLFTELDDIVNATIETVQALGLGMAEAWDIITGAVSTGVSAVGQFFTDLGSDIADIWDDTVGVISGAIDTVVAFVSALPGRIGAFIESIPGRVRTALDAMVDLIIDILGTAIATVIVFFTDMPGQVIGALTAFLVAVRDVFIGARDEAVGSLTSIGTFIESIPGLLAGAWEAVVRQVVSTFTIVKDFITAAWEAIILFISSIPGRVGAFFQQMNDAVVARVTSLVEFVKGIPGQVLAAVGNLGRLLYNAGANVIQGLIDGISSRIGQLRDKISSAVQEIRDHLPFSPAKKGPLSGSGSPQRAGAAIGSMIASGLDSQLASIAGAAGRAADAAGISLSPLGDAGVTPLASPLPGQRGTVLSPVSERTDEQLVVLVTIGGEEVFAIIDKRVEAAVSTEVRRLVAGTRGI
jgi:phage-related protein